MKLENEDLSAIVRALDCGTIKNAERMPSHESDSTSKIQNQEDESAGWEDRPDSQFLWKSNDQLDSD